MFSDEEIDQIIQYLGYPISPQVVTQVKVAVSRAVSASLGVEKRIKGYLRELVRIDGEINEARPFAARTFQTTQSGSANYAPGMRMTALRDEGHRYIAAISTALSLPPYSDFFGGGGAGTVRTVRS